jgi:hypothetical protein
MLNQLTVVNHPWVIVRPLTWQDVPMIETGRITLEMPLSNHGCLIASRLQHFGKCGLRTIELITITAKTIYVRVLASQDRSPTWTTNGIWDHTATEQHSFFR